MKGIRVLAIASFFGILVPGAHVGADEKCNLVVAYMLDDARQPGFGVSIYRCANFWRLELEKFRGRTAGGEAHWSVLDLVELSDVASGEVVVAESCSIDNSTDKAILAIAQQTDEPEIQGILAAWRADQQRGRCISIDTDSVDCWNEASGFS